MIKKPETPKDTSKGGIFFLPPVKKSTDSKKDEKERV